MNDYENIKELRDAARIFGLSGKRVLIVGGAGKMGVEFAKTLLGAGASVFLSDLDGKRLASIAQELSVEAEGRVFSSPCDVSSESDITALFEDLKDKMGGLDVLIYNVMAKPDGYYKDTDNYSVETWKGVVDANLTGAFLCARAAGLLMKESGGSIILTSSVYGVVGPDQGIYKDCEPAANLYGSEDKLNCPASYSASKAGIIGLSRHLATLWGADGIRVNVLVPGGVYDGQEDAFHREYVRRTPLGRMAVWSDYNGAILFLASDASRYMTGSTLVLDGGWTAW